MAKTCAHAHLVNDDICTVTYCAECGHVNLRLGAMTLHLTVRQFDDLAAAFQKAQARKKRLDQIRRDPAAPEIARRKPLH